jgi:glycosyltransferase involved in cell wall biosynthesis
LAAIHQLTPGFAYGDAISNQALIIRDYLRSKGYTSNIFAESVDPSMSSEGQVFKPHLLSRTAGLIYHHSIGTPLTTVADKHPGPKSLVYHNITPAEYVADSDPKLAKQLEQGRKDISLLSRSFSCSVGDSRYNANELAENGFADPGVLPICVTPDKWNTAPDASVIARMSDGKRNILFVGRIIPNKRQDDLVHLLSQFVKLDSKARLILVGGYDPEDPYFRKILKLIEEKQLRTKVLLTGKVSDAQLQAYYRTAHLYCSMSEHEGFGVPLIEAMWFDVPVLAYKSSAVSETMGCGGLLFTSKDDFAQIAHLAKKIIQDRKLKKAILNGQRLRRQHFIPSAVEAKIDFIVNCMQSDLVS